VNSEFNQMPQNRVREKKGYIASSTALLLQPFLFINIFWGGSVKAVNVFFVIPARPESFFSSERFPTSGNDKGSGNDKKGRYDKKGFPCRR
jgi:hypothetical protein